MARKKVIPVPVVLTREQSIEKAKTDFLDGTRRFVAEEAVAVPNRSLIPGQRVYIGALENCVLIEPLLDGKAWVVEYTLVDNNYGKPIATHNVFNAWWTVEIETNLNASKSLFSPDRRGRNSISDLTAFFGYYMHSGLVCNPVYQRGYVWDDFDREQLLTSIFERLEIGSFTFIRRTGFHKTADIIDTRITMDGRTIHIPQNKNHTVEIVDGQQRLTTIINFWMNKFPYKGVFYDDMSARDRGEFDRFSVSYRLIDEHDISEKEIVKLFLQANRGVPQTQDHLQKVQSLYNSMV